MAKNYLCGKFMDHDNIKAKHKHLDDIYIFENNLLLYCLLGTDIQSAIHFHFLNMTIIYKCIFVYFLITASEIFYCITNIIFNYHYFLNYQTLIKNILVYCLKIFNIAMELI